MINNTLIQSAGDSKYCKKNTTNWNTDRTDVQRDIKPHIQNPLPNLDNSTNPIQNNEEIEKEKLRKRIEYLIDYFVKCSSDLYKNVMKWYWLKKNFI